MNWFRLQRSRNQRLLRCVALLCSLLVGITAIAEASHSHPTQKSSANCSICIAVHHSPGKTAATFQSPVVRTLLSRLVASSEETSSSVVLPFALSVRPPPSV